MVVIIIAREFAVSALRSLAASENVVLGAISSAKTKTVLQIISISLLIFYNQLGAFERLAPISLWLAMLASLYSGAEYYVRFAPRVLRQSGRTEAENRS
jgi:phosphatidylglycerophosphate synthase